MTNNAVEYIRNAIVVQAADDWRRLCKDKDTLLSGVLTNKAGKAIISFAEIRRFFKSDWCALLCGNVDPLFILDALERERKAALNEI